VFEKSIELICLREDTFLRVFKGPSYQLFENFQRYTAILSEQEDFEEFIEKVNDLPDEKPLSIYVFSLSSDTYEQSFESITRTYALRPVPEGILAVYRKVFDKKNQGMGDK
jgi:adenine-specific DNA-methyltransferase